VVVTRVYDERDSFLTVFIIDLIWSKTF
jgi:hypothetical protein